MKNTYIFITLLISTCSLDTLSSELTLADLYGPFTWSDGSTSLITNQGSATFNTSDPFIKDDGKTYLKTSKGPLFLSDSLLITLFHWTSARRARLKQVLCKTNIKRTEEENPFFWGKDFVIGCEEDSESSSGLELDVEETER